MRISIVFLMLLLSACSDMLCGAPSENSASVQQFGLAVRDEKAALRIALAIWRSMSSSEVKESEAEWLKEMRAELRGGLWFVTTSTIGLGGGLSFYISPEDGRIV